MDLYFHFCLAFGFVNTSFFSFRDIYLANISLVFATLMAPRQCLVLCCTGTAAASENLKMWWVLKFSLIFFSSINRCLDLPLVVPHVLLHLVTAKVGIPADICLGPIQPNPTPHYLKIDTMLIWFAFHSSNYIIHFEELTNRLTINSL